ncbi:restriction endonuclease subunit S [Mesorhizobium sp. ESP7-2]|uniref:restriction endonuclease subunit S n=1 Tax=Mesorhizobium sp. ESP7-2 TaxID=2876622 RepID=UPI001CCABE23|nr:restriction endonuclease subunit S [Mesorhizobium sp. ESP7-2]MBZ9705699.1 restriction endonuclease subunit S [Mesorhizobium sp. ESP7-2]
MVPEEWRTANVRQLCSKVTDGTHDTPTPVDGGIPYITAIHVKDGHIRFDDCLFLTEDDHREIYRRCNPQFGDLVVVNIGAGVGQCAAVNVTFEFSMKNVALLKPNPEHIDPKFLFQAFRSEESRIGREARSGGAQPFISLRHLGQLRFLVPPIPEQKKIAEILSTWDAAIETTEKLLANAVAQKRAFMQQLLTGKRRLNGFGGPWARQTLRDVAEVIVSNVDKKSVDGDIPVRLCNYMDVYANDILQPSLPFMEATATSAQIKKFGLHVGDVLITKDSETPSDIAVPAYVSATADDLVCGYHLAIIRPGPRASGRFLKFYFEHPHTQTYFASRANGATRFGLRVGSIEEAPIQLPTLEEQERIADAIATVETEAKRLKSSIKLYRAEKAALMQQLLTGKWRVTV